LLLYLLLALSIQALLLDLRRGALLHRLPRLHAGPGHVALWLELLLTLLLALRLPARRALRGPLLEMLSYDGIARLVAIILRTDHLLLLGRARIAIA
jgi:hypothetical protein